MGTYDIAFANKLAEVAQGVVADGIESHEARRTVAYLSRLSMELALKAILEKAGKPVKAIRDLSHDLHKLLAAVDQCEVKIEIAPGHEQWRPGSRLRSATVTFLGEDIPVGIVLEAEKHGASTYPGQIRYGETVSDYPPEVLALAAARVVAWAKEHWGRVRLA